ncbi:hypothetical protein B0H12DRAFT_1234280 [Mycena haematopus]|nr:hypothetical protein B0H12DRAFT_1234280 [Mycena haematopus]
MPTELPPELERKIFETAILCDRGNAALKLNLSLVARRVQYWIDLIQYEAITIKSSAEADKFFELVNWKSHDFITNAVKALCITYHVSAIDASRILSVCSNVRQLACWVAWEKSPHLPQLLSSLHLNQLSIEIGHFLNIPLSPSTWFLGLTHIDLIWWADSPAPDTPSTLGRLPNLTHIALSGTGRSEAESVCLSCASLQVLLVIQIQEEWDSFEATEDEYEFDARIVVAPSDFSRGDSNENWEDVVFRRPKNMWAYAENIVLQREALAKSIAKA